MTDRIRLVVDEESEIVEQLDVLARQEGLSRSDMLRRAIRRLIAATPVPPYTPETNKNIDIVGK